MQILLLGAGAREHAWAWKISQSPLLTKLQIYPGNPGILSVYEKLANSDSCHSLEELAACAKDQGIDLVICGPENYLVDGVVEAFAKKGIPVFGPNQTLAMLEGSKSYAKEVMFAAGIPTAAYQLVEGQAQCRQKAHEFLQEQGAVVIKASGLAAGKGVFVCHDADSIDQAVDRLYGGEMAKAAQTVVLESLLTGRECSYFCFLGEGAVVSLGFAVDYKRLMTGDQGPNTGGMGCYTPVEWLPATAERSVIEKVVNPLIAELARRQQTYTGALYVGLMWGEQGLNVVEFNVRLGDPEAQVLAVNDERDWLQLVCEKVGILPPSQMTKVNAQAEWTYDPMPTPASKAVGVVMAGAGYPYEKSTQQHPLLTQWWQTDGTIADENNRSHANHSTQVFMAGVAVAKPMVPQTAEKIPDACLLTGSGRIVTVVSRAASFKEARSNTYKIVAEIQKYCPSLIAREDIAAYAESIEKKSN